MDIPDGQVWMLHHVGTAYYWTRWWMMRVVSQKSLWSVCDGACISVSPTNHA